MRDLVGREYGEAIVLESIGKSLWRCECKNCGKHIIKTTQSMTKAKTNLCQCSPTRKPYKTKYSASKNNSGSKIYALWYRLKYAGLLCTEWAESFTKFQEQVKYQESKTLIRPNPADLFHSLNFTWAKGARDSSLPILEMQDLPNAVVQSFTGEWFILAKDVCQYRFRTKEDAIKFIEERLTWVK